VAGGHHDAAVRRRIVESREVHPFGPANADVVHIDAAVGQSAAHGVGEAGARQPDVAPHHDALRSEKLRVAARHAVSHIVIQLDRNPAA